MKIAKVATLAVMLAFQVTPAKAEMPKEMKIAVAGSKGPLTASFLTCSAYESTSAEQASDCYRHVIELAAKSYEASKYASIDEASYIEGALEGAHDICNLGKAFVKDHPRNNYSCTMRLNKVLARDVVNAFESANKFGLYNPDVK